MTLLGSQNVSILVRDLIRVTPRPKRAVLILLLFNNYIDYKWVYDELI